VHHLQIARLENIERHLASWQEQRARKWKHRDSFRKISRPTIFGVDRHSLPSRYESRTKNVRKKEPSKDVSDLPRWHRPPGPKPQKTAPAFCEHRRRPICDHA